MRRLRGRLGVLEERPFRMLWLGRTSSLLGDALIPVALAFAVLQELDASASELGFVLAAFSLARVGFMLVGGVWADRLERRLLMVACDVVRAAVEFFTFAMLLAGAMELWMFALTAALFGAASAFFGPASTGLVAETVSRPRFQQANALVSLSESGAKIGGPALAGILVATAGPAWVFAVDGATFVASAAFLLAVRIPRRVPPPRQHFLRDLAAGWSELTARTWLWTSVLAVSVGNAFTMSFYVLGPVVFASELGGAADWGLALAVAACGQLAGSVVALRWRPERPMRTALRLYAATALPPLTLIAPLPPVVVGVAAGLSLAGIVIGNAIWDATQQERIPGDVLARVDSYTWLGSLVLTPLGLAAAGPAAAAAGMDAALVAASAIALAAYAAALAVPSARNLRREDGDAMPAPRPAASAAGESPAPAPPGLPP
jgi:MFS family permease